MSILTPAILTTTQLVSGLVASAKNALELAKSSSDLALKASISELYDSLLDVKGRVVDLDEENRKLRAQLALMDEVVGPFNPHGYFYKKTDEAKEKPLCPKCWQSQPSKISFMSPLTAGWRKCVVCGFIRRKSHPNSASQPNNLNYWE